jgi:hypothetical protein
MAKHQKGEPKVSYGVRVRKHVYEQIERIAAEKRWSESQTTDELLAWTIVQLGIAGSFDLLMGSSIPSRSPKQGMARLQKAHENLTAVKFSHEEKKKLS